MSALLPSNIIWCQHKQSFAVFWFVSDWSIFEYWHTPGWRQTRRTDFDLVPNGIHTLMMTVEAETRRYWMLEIIVMHLVRCVLDSWLVLGWLLIACLQIDMLTWTGNPIHLCCIYSLWFLSESPAKVLSIFPSFSLSLFLNECNVIMYEANFWRTSEWREEGRGKVEKSWWI